MPKIPKKDGNVRKLQEHVCILHFRYIVFRDFFDRFTLISSIFDKIAEGPDSFCHHCKLKLIHRVEKCKSVSRVKRDLIRKIKN